ncbi:rod shape-determining protein MreC [Salimicrobium humidisoli]|uniref:Cell shape-determining protein MreC n=1 Tax=Salimicrobium humidisoli TaxID=2029857 RepID=A0ABX4HU65_9BACI|nr:rod shape-determining protein MreC [Salimicrobium humidisoli]PBB06781.1 rod shape-determining protein MreC [Salimicrobium humidisoli]
MPSFFRRKILILVLVAFIIFVTLIGFSIRERENISAPERFILDTTGVLQSIIHTPVEWVDNSIETFQDVLRVYEQNEVLKERLAEYEGLIVENQELEEEIEELRGTTERAEGLEKYSPVQASVIARSPERWFEQVTINRGSKHGIEKDMAVITKEGLIGKIQSTAAFHSTVKLLSGFDTSNKISSWVVKKNGDNVFGLVEGYDEESGRLLLGGINLDVKLKKGEKVISTGLGGVFPSRLQIGTVDEVKNDEYGLTKTAYIEPAADLYEVNQVIITRRSDQNDKESQEENS